MTKANRETFSGIILNAERIDGTLRNAGLDPAFFLKLIMINYGTDTKTKLQDFSVVILNFERIDGRKTEFPFMNFSDFNSPSSLNEILTAPLRISKILGPV